MINLNLKDAVLRAIYVKYKNEQHLKLANLPLEGIDSIGIQHILERKNIFLSIKEIDEAIAVLEKEQMINCLRVIKTKFYTINEEKK